MKYTCPKCGKTMELSIEVLINNEYQVVCPQCLAQLRIVGDTALVADVQPGSRGQSAADHRVIDLSDDDVTVVPPAIPVTHASTASDIDPLYDQAVKYLMTCTSVTVQMLRDHFSISESRAAQLVRLLEDRNIIGPANGGGHHQILIPHRGMYGTTQQAMAQQQSVPTGAPARQRRRSGCLTWIIGAMLLMYLMKACGL